MLDCKSALIFYLNNFIILIRRNIIRLHKGCGSEIACIYFQFYDLLDLPAGIAFSFIAFKTFVIGDILIFDITFYLPWRV
jgi:hypothetical protein